MRCPSCDTPLRAVKARAGVGYDVALDQCPTCGGIWCDRWEVFPLTTAAAEHLDPVDEQALTRSTRAAAATPRCPRCRARLRPMRDPQLPADAHVARCPNCDGLWFTRGELRRFKQRARRRGPAGLPDVERLARRVLQTGRPTPTVERLADAMDDPTPTEDAGAVRDDVLRGIAWATVQVLLRLLLRL